MNNVKMECSFSSWYAAFEKDSFKAKILLIPDDVLKYLEHGAFLLPLEAVKLSPKNSEWTKEPSTINEEEVLILFIYLSLKIFSACYRYAKLYSLYSFLSSSFCFSIFFISLFLTCCSVLNPLINLCIIYIYICNMYMSQHNVPCFDL